MLLLKGERVVTVRSLKAPFMSTGEAETKLGRVRREYLSKHLTLRKRVLSVVGTLGE